MSSHRRVRARKAEPCAVGRTVHSRVGRRPDAHRVSGEVHDVVPPRVARRERTARSSCAAGIGLRRSSNSNELHWERNTHELRIIELFEFAISSHQVGLCKPDPEIFKLAIERARVSSPQAIVFFDDLAANVEAAKSAGLRAYQVRGVDELRRRLASEGLSPATDGP